MNGEETAERIALRQRLGSGARFDAPNAPSEALQLARRGTAYFARILNELTDDALDEPSQITGYDRRHVIAFVSYEARIQAECLALVRQGDALIPYIPIELDAPQVREGATLPARALRHLFEHSAIHLNVEWRDLDNHSWNRRIGSASTPVTVRDLPMVRARSLWSNSLNIGSAVHARYLPESVRKLMIAGQPA